MAQSASGKQRREDVPPVISANGRVDIRRAAELAKHLHQHILQQATVFEIHNQARQGHVEMRAFGFRPFNARSANRSVQIPFKKLVVFDIDERDPRFHQPTGEQTSLPQPRSSIAIAQSRIFA